MQILRETVDVGQWAKAVQSVLKQAQEGNLKAFSALAKYLLPLPAQRLKISEEAQEEYRVAGYTAADLNDQMLQRLAQKIDERRAYEDELALAGVTGYRASNGNGNGHGKAPTRAKKVGKSTRKSRRVQ